MSREEINRSQVTGTASSLDERKIIVAVQNGDKQAFGRLVRIYQKRLFRMLYGLTGSFDQAEDLMQDTFVRAYNAIGRFRTEYDFYPWLATIGRNLAFSFMHREERKESLDQLADRGFDPASAALGPLEHLLESEGQKRFYRALQALPAQFRTVFVLRHFEQMDYAEIASYLKIPPGTVDSRLYRARKLLMEALEDLL